MIVTLYLYLSMRKYKKHLALPKPKFKEYASIRSGLKPSMCARKTSSCSGIVIVENGHDRGYSNITFSDYFVARLSKVMMYGVNAAFPVYLNCVYKKGVGLWYTYCVYFNSRERVLLWATEEYPYWFGRIIKPKYLK